MSLVERPTIDVEGQEKEDGQSIPESTSDETRPSHGLKRGYVYQSWLSSGRMRKTTHKGGKTSNQGQNRLGGLGKDGFEVLPEESS